METITEILGHRPWWEIWIASSIAYYLMAYTIAILSYTILYKVFRRAAYPRKLQPEYTSDKMVKFEVSLSFVTLFIHSLAGGVVIYAAAHGHTFVYTDISEFGWSYYIISVFLMIFLHDTYFYWTHRLMHLPSLYPVIHRIHHKSVNPSPWAAFSGSPYEAAIAGGIFPLIAWTIPAHWSAMIIYLIYMLFMSVMGHAGFEFYPRWFNRTWIGRWQTTASHHNMHHKYFNGNYGIYFNFWDRMMKTEHPHYDKEYEAFFDNQHKVNSNGTINENSYEKEQTISGG